MMQAITQGSIKLAKPAILAVKEAENTLNDTRSVQVMSRTGDQYYNCQHLIGRQQTKTNNYETMKQS